MKAILVFIAIIAFMIGAENAVGYRNLQDIKAHANQTWQQNGYEVIGYEGYQGSLFHGAKVWYIVQRKARPDISYHGFLTKWSGEYHIYSLKAIDAIAPRNVE